MTLSFRNTIQALIAGSRDGRVNGGFHFHCTKFIYVGTGLKFDLIRSFSDSVMERRESIVELSDLKKSFIFPKFIIKPCTFSQN